MDGKQKRWAETTILFFLKDLRVSLSWRDPRGFGKNLHDEDELRVRKPQYELFRTMKSTARTNK